MTMPVGAGRKRFALCAEGPAHFRRESIRGLVTSTKASYPQRRSDRQVRASLHEPIALARKELIGIAAASVPAPSRQSLSRSVRRSAHMQDFPNAAVARPNTS